MINQDANDVYGMFTILDLGLYEILRNMMLIYLNFNNNFLKSSDSKKTSNPIAKHNVLSNDAKSLTGSPLTVDQN